MATDATPEDLRCFAKLCEKSHRYEEMVETLKKMVKVNPDLSKEERDLLSVAYKGAMSARRASWRSLCSIQQDITSSDLTDEQMLIAEEYRVKIENELLTICHDILDCVNETLLPKANDAEAKVFYFKMKGDYYRYLVEVAPVDERDGLIEIIKHSYKDSYAIATAQLKPSNATRLNLALNYSVFNYEVMKLAEVARQFAKKTLDEAMAEIGTSHVSEETETALQLIRDNLDTWRESGTRSATT